MEIKKELQTIKEQIQIDFIKLAFVNTNINVQIVEPVYALGNQSARYGRIVVK